MANTFDFDNDQSQPDSGSADSGSPEPGNNNPESGEGRNRTFLIAAIVLGAIVLLSLVCMAVYALLILPGRRASAQATSDANAAASTQAADIAQQTQLAASFTATLAPTDTSAPLPTETLVVVFASATPSVVAPTSDPATATVEALQTQLANSQNLGAGTKAAGSGTPGTPVKLAGTSGTAGTPGKLAGTPGTPGTPGTQTLAKTGVADEFGLPSLVIAFILVLAVIMLSRRLRQSHQ